LPYLRFKMKTEIYWDDPTFEETIDTATVHLVPFEIYPFIDDSIGSGRLYLGGLIVSPTCGRVRQFRRLGVFEIFDQGRENLVPTE
jgi:hypothetical protein